MSFLNPFLLIGLLAVAIPLLIHLLNLRSPSRVRFSTLVFFESLKTSVLKRIKIKKWLLLALRTAAILFLVVALARPFIPSESGVSGLEGDPAVVALLIENSPGMDRVDRNGPFIDQARQVAEAIIRQAGSEDRIVLDVTHGETLDLPPMGRQTALVQLQEIQTANKGNFIHTNLAGLLRRLDRTPEAEKKVYLISSGRADKFSQLDRSDPWPGGELQLRVITVGEDQRANVAVTDIALQSRVLSRDKPVSLVAEVKNYGNSAIENHFLSLEQNRDIVSQKRVHLDAGESAAYTFEILPDDGEFLTGSFLLEGDELTFDNRRYFSIRMPETQTISYVRGEEAGRGEFRSFLKPVLEAAASEREQIRIVASDWDELVLTGPDQPDLVVLDGVIRIPEYRLDDLIAYLQTGGGLMFFPSEQGEIRSYNRFLERINAGQFTDLTGSYGSFQAIDRVENLREGHPVLEEIFDKSDDEGLRIDLPEIYYHYLIDSGERAGRYQLLNTELGHPLLFEQTAGDGRIMISTIGAGPGWSNFPVKPIFAPLFYRAATYLASGDRGGLLTHTLGTPFEFPVPGSPEEIEIVLNEQRTIPERQSSFQGITIFDEARDWSPGLASVEYDGEKIKIAVNQSTMESDLTSLHIEQLEELLKDRFGHVSAEHYSGDESEFAEKITKTGSGSELWHWFIMGAIILLLTESVAGRLFKAESIQ